MSFITALKGMTPEKSDLIDNVYLFAFGQIFEISSATILDNNMLSAVVKYGPKVDGSGARPSHSSILIPSASIEGIQFFFNRANCVVAKVEPTYEAVRDYIFAATRRKS